MKMHTDTYGQYLNFMTIALNFAGNIDHEILDKLKTKELNPTIEELRIEHRKTADAMFKNKIIKEFNNISAKFFRLSKTLSVLVFEINEPEDTEGYYFIGISIIEKMDSLELDKYFFTLDKHEDKQGYIISWSDGMRGSFCDVIKPELWRFVKVIKARLTEIQEQEERKRKKDERTRKRK